MPILQSFKSDLEAATQELTAFQAGLLSREFDVTALRIIELMIWIQTEPRGYFRDERKA